ASLQGSGPAGRIVRKDVEAVGVSGGAGAAAPTQAPRTTAKGEGRGRGVTKLQEGGAPRGGEAKAAAAPFYLSAAGDIGAAVADRARIKANLAAAGDPVPSFNDMVVKACAIALRRFPRANGAYRDGRFELYSRVNVGIAVAAEDALLVPTIFDADRKG